MAIQKRNFIPTLLVLTSPNGTARNGASLSTQQVAVGSLVIECTAAITTSSVLATFKAQGSNDGTTWYDLYLGTGVPISTATPTGTASEVVTTRALIVPPAAHAYPLVRGVATLSGAATASADTTTLSYRFVQPGGLESAR
jgi:hypothetical protein